MTLPFDKEITMNKSSTYLSPYEFTRVELYSNFVPKNVNADPDLVANTILKTSPTIRKTKEYQNTKDMYIECTMSCNLEECQWWLKSFMKKAISYGEQTKNLDWKEKYLAAYDILKGLK